MDERPIRIGPNTNLCVPAWPSRDCGYSGSAGPTPNGERSVLHYTGLDGEGTVPPLIAPSDDKHRSYEKFSDHGGRVPTPAGFFPLHRSGSRGDLRAAFRQDPLWSAERSDTLTGSRDVHPHFAKSRPEWVPAGRGLLARRLSRWDGCGLRPAHLSGSQLSTLSSQLQPQPSTLNSQPSSPINSPD